MSDRLTGLQLAFVDAYVGKAKFNATEASRLAPYKGNGKTLAVIGFENLRKPNIVKEIAARLQARAMSSDELVMRLGEQARIDISEYYNDGIFDIKKFKLHGYGHLIKSIKKDRDGRDVYEFTNKEKSQELIARHLGILVDKSEVVEINAGSLTDFEQWKKEQGSRQGEAKDTMGQFDERST